MASPLPSVSETILGWFRPLQLVFVQSTVKNMEVSRSEKLRDCQGVIQPLSITKLRLKPEGERAWKWKLLHTTPDVDLKEGEEFTIKGTRYRVMGKGEYGEYGVLIYQLVEDYSAN